MCIFVFIYVLSSLSSLEFSVTSIIKCEYVMWALTPPPHHLSSSLPLCSLFMGISFISSPSLQIQPHQTNLFECFNPLSLSLSCCMCVSVKERERERMLINNERVCIFRIHVFLLNCEWELSFFLVLENIPYLCLGYFRTLTLWILIISLYLSLFSAQHTYLTVSFPQLSDFLTTIAFILWTPFNKATYYMILFSFFTGKKKENKLNLEDFFLKKLFCIYIIFTQSLF